MKNWGRCSCWAAVVAGILMALYAGAGGLAAVGEPQVIGDLTAENCGVMEFLLQHEGHRVRVAGGRIIVRGREVVAEMDCRTADGQFAFTWPYTLLQDINKRPALEE